MLESVNRPSQSEMLVQRIRPLGNKKRAELFRLLAQKGVDLARLPIVPLAEREGLPLSYAQQRQWFLWQLDPASSAYNMPTVLRLRGVLNVPALRRSFEALVARHDVLRTRFLQDGVQHIDLEGRVQVREEAVEGPLEQAINAEIQTPFDLLNGPLLRVKLLRLADDHHVLIITQHHIVSDAWSLQVLVQELIQLYQSFNLDLPALLPPLALQYADYAVWQRHWMEAGERDRQLQYWQQQLLGAPSVLELPSDRPRPASPSHRGAQVGRELPTALSEGLRRLARAEGCSLFSLLLASFQLLLQRYSGQPDICVGVPSANRNRSETQNLLGFFVNTLVLRSRVNSSLTTRGLLQQVKATLQDAQAHQDLPFEELVDVLRPQRSLSHSPLFQVMFNHLSSEEGGEQLLAGLQIEALEGQRQTAHFDLTLDCVEQGANLHGRFTYATDLFDAGTVERLFDHWHNLLHVMVATPDVALAELDMLNADERELLLHTWNAGGLDQPSEQRCVHQLIEEQARIRPQAEALRVGEQCLSYQQLNAWANRLAVQLREQGVGPEVRVGIAIERSVAMTVSLLAVLKAGGAYVPLDPAHPAERLAYMMEDSGIRLLLTQEHLLDRLPQLEGVQRLAVSSDGRELEAYSADNGNYPVHADNLAYLIYTSGSTGKPKGVAVSHGPLAMHCLAIAERYGMTPEDRELQFASINFDGAHERWLVPLVAGSFLLQRDNELWDAERCCAEIARHGITIACFTPSYLQQVAEYIGEAGRTLPIRSYTVGGEGTSRATFDQIQRVLQPARLINGYGPTETVITPLLWRAYPDTRFDAQYMPVGQPVGARTAYVLDADLQPVPVGIAGELYIGGEGVARGYHQRPRLTAERFVADPFSRTGGRLYRTGDLVRYCADSVVDYLGRVDHQVKIRGFRIELGEVESALMGLNEVREAVVTVAGEERSKRLLAYVVLAPGVGDEATVLANVRLQLRGLLPDYMVPAQLLALPAMPLNPNGKLDRHALPAPSLQRSDSYRAPHTAQEQQLAALWSEVLHVDIFGLDDSFFELGGNSILALEVVSRARQLGITLSLKALMSSPRISELLQADAGREPLLALNQAGPASRQLFCLHGGHGTVFDYAPLAKALEPQWAVYGVQCRMLLDSQWLDSSLETMARDYAELIVAAQPQGPYHLLGWSLGGALSVLVAAELEQRGAEVAFVGLVDSYLPQVDVLGWQLRLQERLLAMGADESAIVALCAGWEGRSLVEVDLRDALPLVALTGYELTAEERLNWLRTTVQLDELAVGLQQLPSTNATPYCWWAQERESAAMQTVECLSGKRLQHKRMAAGHFQLLADPQLIDDIVQQTRSV